MLGVRVPSRVSVRGPLILAWCVVMAFDTPIFHRTPGFARFPQPTGSRELFGVYCKLDGTTRTHTHTHTNISGVRSPKAKSAQELQGKVA